MTQRAKTLLRAPISIFSILITGLLVVSCSTASKNEQKSPEELSNLYTQMGTQALLRGEFPQAIEDLRKALSLDRKNAIAHNHLGLAYFELGKKDLARQEVMKATEADPNYSDAYVNLGNFFAAEGKYTEARAEFKKALENLEYKTRHRALTNLAQLAIRENNYDEAKKFLYQSIQANPHYCMSHFLLGSIYMRENSTLRASDEFKKSVAHTCVSNLEGQFQLGLAYLKNKEYDKARGQFVMLVEQYPQSEQAQRAGEQLKNIP